MILIEEAKYLAPSVKWFRLEAPDISLKAQPGQFVIVRAEEVGERIPLTIADFDGSRFIELVVQEVGEGTRKINSLKKGDYFLNVAGPLGHPSEIDNFGTVALVGGGIGIAPIYPIARAMKQAQNKVIVIIGTRTKELVFWEEKLHSVSDRVIVCTDDGSYGIKGVVTVPLNELLESGERIDRVVAIGPAIMMKFVAVTTQPYHVKTIVSLNSLMLDGTGMCGCCRVEVGGKTKFACVDGPAFDAHQVDFELLLDRMDIYKNEEHLCQLAGKV